MQMLLRHRTMRPRIVPVAKDTRIRALLRQQILEPIHAVIGGPGPLAVAVEAMNCNNAEAIYIRINTTTC